MSSISYSDESEYQKLCGKIFLTPVGTILCHCTLCDQKIGGFQNYVKHLKTTHNILDALDHTSEEYETLEEGDLLITFNCDDEPVALYYESDDENSFDENVPNAVEVNDDKLEIRNISNTGIYDISTAKTQEMVTELERSAPTDEISTVKRTEQKQKIHTRLYKCTECNFACSNRSNLAGHKKRHSTFRRYLCTECTKAFYTNSELKRHVATHRGDRPYLCQDCGSGFPSQDKLALHRKRHLNIRDNICDICGMTFYNSNLLRNHMRVHSDDRPYKCNFCDASFKRKTGLNSHIKTHQNKREYMCKLCSASFNQNPGLHSHMKCKHPGTTINGETVI